MFSIRSGHVRLSQLWHKPGILLWRSKYISMSRHTKYSPLLTALRHIRIRLNSGLEDYVGTFCERGRLRPAKLRLVSPQGAAGGGLLPAGAAGTRHRAVSHLGTRRGQEPRLAVTPGPRFGAARLTPALSSSRREGHARGAKNLPFLFSMVPFYMWVEGKNPTSCCYIH